MSEMKAEEKFEQRDMNKKYGNKTKIQPHILQKKSGKNCAKILFFSLSADIFDYINIG